MTMHAPLRWYFDFISPFSYLQWPRVRDLRAGRPDRPAIVPVPILLGAVLDARGQKGPAEIVGKREFTYRHVLWQARRQGVALRFPPRHPFNPLHALRLCIAAGTTADAVSAIFDWIWADGRAVDRHRCAGAAARAPQVNARGARRRRRSRRRCATTRRPRSTPACSACRRSRSAMTLFWGNDAHDFAVCGARRSVVARR